MDPTCGHCLGPSCNGSPGFTDPKCPVHGTAAHAAREARLNEDVAKLSRRSLRSLVKKSNKREHVVPPEYRILREDAASEEFFRKKSEQMLDRAKSGISRIRLFTIHPSTALNPEAGLSESQRKACQYFEARKLRIVFREDWDSHLLKFDVYAVW